MRLGMVSRSNDRAPPWSNMWLNGKADWNRANKTRSQLNMDLCSNPVCSNWIEQSSDLGSKWLSAAASSNVTIAIKDWGCYTSKTIFTIIWKGTIGVLKSGKIKIGLCIVAVRLGSSLFAILSYKLHCYLLITVMTENWITKYKRLFVRTAF